MSLRLKSDDQLLSGLDRLFHEERINSQNILLYLKEIRSRRLYAKRGFGSLVEMLIKQFRQSEAAARQRIKVLELMLEVPVVEERLVSGDLNLSTVAMAQRKILEQEKIVGKKLSVEKKAEIVDAIIGKTLEQTEIELFRLLPETERAPRTSQRRVSADATRLSVTLPNEVCDQMNRLREIWSHIDPNMDPVEIMRRAFDIALDKVDPMRRKPAAKKSTAAQKFSPGEVANASKDGVVHVQASDQNAASNNHFLASSTHSEASNNHSQAFGTYSEASNNHSQASSTYSQTSRRHSQASSTHSEASNKTKQSSDSKENSHSINQQNVTQVPADSIRQRVRVTYYSKELDRQLWQRAESRCEFVDPLTNRRCDCTTLLQHEHVIPLALGGANDLSNLQLLCRTHNLLRARQVFGDKKIDHHQRHH